MQYLESGTGIWVGNTPQCWTPGSLAIGQGKIGLEHLESCSGVWVGKTPPSLWSGEKWFAISRVMHWSLGRKDSPLTNGHERSGLKHLESCTEVCVGQTPPLLLGRREVVSNIWSHALEFG